LFVLVDFILRNEVRQTKEFRDPGVYLEWIMDILHNILLPEPVKGFEIILYIKIPNSSP